MNQLFYLIVFFASSICFGASSAQAGPDITPVPNGFHYQGLLEMDGQPFNGTIDIRFKVYGDSPTPIQTNNYFNAQISDGLIQLFVSLDSTDIDGSPLHAEVEVRSPPGTGPYTTLSPVQQINSVPYAMQSTNAVHATTADILNLPADLSSSSDTPSLIIKQSSPDPFAGAALRLTRSFDDKTLSEYIDRVLEVESADTSIGILATAEYYPIAGIVDSSSNANAVAIIGQVDSATPRGQIAIQAFNAASSNSALLGTDEFAGFFAGDLRVTGDITKSYSPGSYDLAAPIAYGAIFDSGQVLSGTPNFSCVYNTVAKRYEIQIDNEVYNGLDYVTIVTPRTNVDPGLTVNTLSISGRLIVRGYSPDINDDTRMGFHFVVYKPAGTALIQGQQRPPLQPLMTPSPRPHHQQFAPRPTRPMIPSPEIPTKILKADESQHPPANPK